MKNRKKKKKTTRNCGENEEKLRRNFKKYFSLQFNRTVTWFGLQELYS